MARLPPWPRPSSETCFARPHIASTRIATVARTGSALPRPTPGAFGKSATLSKGAGSHRANVGISAGPRFPDPLAHPINVGVTQPFVPLRVFSSYTMLEGAMEPKTIAERAAKLGFPAAALTDRNGLYGAMAFGDGCIAKGVQPIVGVMLGVSRPPEIGGQEGID